MSIILYIGIYSITIFTMDSKLSLYIKQQHNILDGITLKEPFERNILLQLINSDLLRETFNNTYSQLIHHTEQTQLKKYLGLQTNGEAIITYKRRKNNPFGRCDPLNALGLYPIRREIRHTLAESWGVDVDAENCHPELLLQLAESSGIDCGLLKEYVINRDEFMKELIDAYGCDREDAKIFFIITIYGAGFNKWIESREIDYNKCADIVKNTENGNKTIKELTRMRKFRNDIKNIQTAIFEANPHITEIAHALKKERGITDYNIVGTVCSYVLQEWEVRVLECVFVYCVDKKYIKNDVCALCADGLILERRYYKTELLKELQDEVFNKIGFKLNFVEKKMDKSYSKELINHFDFHFEEKGITDSTMAECFSILYGDKFIKNNGIIYFYNGGYWEVLDNKYSLLHNFVDNVYYKYLIKSTDKKIDKEIECYKKYLITKNQEIPEDFKEKLFEEIHRKPTKKEKPQKEKPKNEKPKKEKALTKIQKLEKEVEDLKNAEIEAKKTTEEKEEEARQAQILLNAEIEAKKKTEEKEAQQAQILLNAKQLNDEIENEKKKYFKIILEFLGIKSTFKTFIQTLKYRNPVINDILNKIMRNYIVFNNDPFLFAFNNKVYDLERGVFMPSKYDQYISYTCGYDHSNIYPTERIIELKNLINSIFPNEKIRDIYMLSLSTGMCGLLLENLFIATGVGGNGKSLTNDLAMKTFGNYGYKMNSAILMHELKGGANPELANLDGKRFVLVQEPAGTMVSSTIKEITGGKDLNARKCFSNECGVKLVLSLFVEVNVLPKIDEVGVAVERRIRATPFNVQFMSQKDYNEQDDKTNIGIINTYYKTEQFKDEMKQAFFEILCGYFKTFRENNYTLPEYPAECKAITRDYLASSDNMYDWFLTMYEKAPENEDEVVYISDLYATFTRSNVWDLMTKKDKLKNNKRFFTDNIEKNLFLKRFIKQRDTRYKNEYHKKSYIVGHRKIEQDYSNGGGVCDALQFEIHGETDATTLTNSVITKKQRLQEEGYSI